jgi:hypothetical protein
MSPQRRDAKPRPIRLPEQAAREARNVLAQYVYLRDQQAAMRSDGGSPSAIEVQARQFEALAEAAYRLAFEMDAHPYWAARPDLSPSPLDGPRRTFAAAMREALLTEHSLNYIKRSAEHHLASMIRASGWPLTPPAGLDAPTAEVLCKIALYMRQAAKIDRYAPSHGGALSIARAESRALPGDGGALPNAALRMLIQWRQSRGVTRRALARLLVENGAEQGRAVEQVEDWIRKAEKRRSGKGDETG